MTPRLVPMTPACRRLVSLVVAAAIAAAAGRTQAAPLVWEADLQAALEAGRTRHQQVVVFFSADTPECRRFEAEGLEAAIVREGLANLVPVRVEGDAAAAEQFASPGPPALVFVNPLTRTVFHRIGGWHGVERLAREIVHARRAIGLPLTPGLGPVARRMFSLDEEKASGLLDAGDARGLAALLAPAAADESRLADYCVVQVVLPRGLTPDDVTFLAGSDCLVGNPVTAAERQEPLAAARPPDLSACSAELPLPGSGLVLVPVAREQRPEIALRITAAGCLPVEDRVRFAAEPPGSAVQERRYALRRLDRTTAVRFAGRVLTADGRKAAGAVVRIVDWLPQPSQPAAATTTGTDGGFAFPQVPPGRWLVRAEYPGGEREQVVEIAPRGATNCEIVLEPVTTVTIRFAVQTQEFSQRLTGDGVQTGTATMSVATSRIVLARGTRVRTFDSSDVALAQTPLADDDTIPAEDRARLEPLPDGTPVWYLLDAAYDEAFRPLSGLHRETRPFDAIDVVRPGGALPDEDWSMIGPVLPEALASSRRKPGYFELVRGVPVRVGDVFTLRSADSNCFAKIEVTDVTLVTPASPPPP